MSSNSILLNKMATLMNALMHKVCVRAAVLYKNIKLLLISVYFIVKWQNYKM